MRSLFWDRSSRVQPLPHGRGSVLMGFILGMAMGVVAVPAVGQVLYQNQTLIDGGTTRVAVRGLDIELSNLWVENPGYRPLRVTITSAAPPTADRNLTIVVEIDTVGGRRSGKTTVEEDIQIAAGETKVRGTIPVPRAGYTGNYLIKLFEDGVPIKTPHPVTLPSSQQYWNLWMGQRFPRILFVGDKQPDTGALGQYFGAAAYYHRLQTGGWQAANVQAFPGKVTLPPYPAGMSVAEGDLPDRWIEYTCFDVVCLSRSRLENLWKHRPEATRAVMAWVQGGGTLWIFGAGGEVARLAELDPLLDPSPAEATSASRPPSGTSQWTKPPASSFGKRPSWITWNGRNQVTIDDQVYNDKAQIEALWDWSRNSPATPKQPTFRFRELVFGRVIAIAADDPFPGDPWQWGWIAETMGERSSWTSRYGCIYNDVNDEFWNFLVPGVGLAPVIEFQVLISLFVLLIGPVNYLVLRRRKRLHLLVLTIPAGALLVTGALFAYAIVADGLSVRLRARSVTRIDQRRCEAVCWARLSYYAGLAPGGGLNFSDDVAVLPYVPDEDTAAGKNRLVIWDDQQRLPQGWLASRTPTQYFTVRPRASRRGLKITPAGDAAGGVKVENQLGAAIRALAVRTHDGKYYWTTSLAAGASGTAHAATEADVMTERRKILAANEPTFPPGVGQGFSRGPFGMPRSYSRSRYGYYGPQGNMPVSSPGTSLMELSLKGGGNELTPGSYFAVVERQPELELGTPVAHEEGSFHVVLGEW